MDMKAVTMWSYQHARRCADCNARVLLLKSLNISEDPKTA